MRLLTAVLSLLFSFALLSCGGTPQKPSEPTPPDEATDQAAEEAASAQEDAAAKREAADQASALDDDTGLTAEQMQERATQKGAQAEADTPPETQLVHFPFDSHRVKDDDMTIVDEHGRFLANHPDRQVQLAGHADERGTREYNMALGEQRAQAVARLLKLHGVAAAQIETVSYGEEQPLAYGSNETAWTKNRRVEFVYED